MNDVCHLNNNQIPDYVLTRAKVELKILSLDKPRKTLNSNYDKAISIIEEWHPDNVETRVKNMHYKDPLWFDAYTNEMIGLSKILFLYYRLANKLHGDMIGLLNRVLYQKNFKLTKKQWKNTVEIKGAKFFDFFSKESVFENGQEVYLSSLPHRDFRMKQHNSRCLIEASQYKSYEQYRQAAYEKIPTENFYYNIFGKDAQECSFLSEGNTGIVVCQAPIFFNTALKKRYYLIHFDHWPHLVGIQERFLKSVRG